MFKHAKITCAILLLGMASWARGSADLERLTAQFQQFCFEHNGGEEAAMGMARNLKADGTWADIHYQSRSRSGWQAIQHLVRVEIMTRAFKLPGLANSGRPELGAAVHKAFGAWLERDPQNPNWWYNEIGVPMLVGNIAIMLREDLRPAEFEACVNKILPRSKIGMTGQNRVWLASNTLVRGLLMKNEALVREAAEAIAGEIRVGTAEGIQPDFSFHQHGPQQQFGNYGLSYARSAAMWMRIFAGTPYAMGPEKTAILRDYLLQGENWVVWNGRMDLSACGRQLGVDAQINKAGSLGTVMTLMAELDPSHGAEYQAYLKRNSGRGANDLAGNRAFWRSDFMVHRRPGFYASVKMCSRRTIGAESLNGENLSGYHLADGALYLMRTGEEYENIQPVWDWQKLPGTTVAQLPQGPPRFKTRKMDSAFVGGVSNGHDGCAALDLNEDGLRGQKVWFFAGDAVACLGAGLNSATTATVVTTVNQCLLRGDVTVGDGKSSQTLTVGLKRTNKLRWAWHDGVGYVLPEAAQVVIGRGEQRGSWSNVAEKETAASGPVRANLFLMAIDHGPQPRAASYCYLAFPGVELDKMAGKASQPGIEIMENSEKIQAVRAAARKLTMAVFHEAAALGQGGKLAVDRPCLAMVDEMGTAPQLTVADPTQSLKSVKITWKGKTVTAELPQGGEAGKSVSVTLEK